jgi:predicted site-specific integrase-resolvase
VEKLYTVKEFLQIFKISRHTYYQWKNKKIIEPIKIGGSIRIPESEIRKIMQEGNK